VDDPDEPGHDEKGDEAKGHKRFEPGPVLLNRTAVGQGRVTNVDTPQLHPLVPPQVSHFKHVPFLTIVKLPHSPQASPS